MYHRSILGPDMPSCTTDFTQYCRLLFEVNGGFFLLTSSHRTIEMYHMMITWLQQRPTEHDQDAMRYALRMMHSRGGLKWVREDGKAFPEWTG